MLPIRIRSTALLTGAFALFLPAAAMAADAKAQTQALVDAFKQVKVAPEGGNLSAADKKANTAAFAKLDAFFDYDSLCESSIQSIRKKFDTKQHKLFVETFTELIRRVAYPDSGDMLQKAQLDIKSAKVKGNSASVDMNLELPEEDLEMLVTFFWKKDSKSGSWKLIDLAFDGSKLTKDYGSQFARIVKKSGVDGFLKKLTTKLEQTPL